MSKLMKLLASSLAAASIAAPVVANAAELRSVSCSVTMNCKVETNSGTHSYFTSLGVAGEHTTDHMLACARLKD